MRRVLRWTAGVLATLVALVAAALLLLDTSVGHRWIAARLAGVETASGLRFGVGRIDGSIYGKARLSDLRVYDTRGLLLQAPTAALDWSPFAWARNRLDITSAEIPQATLFHAPATRPTGKHGPILPGFDIHVGALRVDRLVLAPAVLGSAREGRLTGRADVRAGRALVELAADVAGSDRLLVKLDAEPDRDRFDIAVTARGAAGGALAKLTGFTAPVALDVTGDGSWRRWRGTAVGLLGRARVVDLALGVEAGRYRMSGTVAPSVVLHGKLQRLTEPRVQVAGDATLVDRRLDGTLSVRSPAVALKAVGAVDLATSAYRNVRVTGQLLRPPSLFPNMTARNLRLVSSFDGPFATARFKYRLEAERFAFDNTGFEGAQAAGGGRLSRSPVALPVRFVARRVTGVGDVAGGILQNLSVDGALMVTGKTVTGEGLRLRSDKLSGLVGLTLDLKTGKFDVEVNGGLSRYLIPGIGLVDVRTTLNVVPGPGGKGTRVVGRGTAEVVRLDNAFFRSLAGGLPRVETALERTPDKVMHFTNLRLVAPALRLQGSGYRRPDGSFHLEAAGVQSTYGPLTMVLDGRIERPTLDLRFARPIATLGLRDWQAHLDPTPEGFAFRATGQSRLGPASVVGAILLPPGGQAAVSIGALTVTGTRASGLLNIVPGGFDGRLQVAGGGYGGQVVLRPVGAVQQVELHLDMNGARIGVRQLRLSDRAWGRADGAGHHDGAGVVAIGAGADLAADRPWPRGGAGVRPPRRARGGGVGRQDDRAGASIADTAGRR